MTTPPKARRYNTQAMASITPQTPPPAEPTASDGPAPPRLEVARRSDVPASDASERQARLERFLATEPIDDGLGDFRLTKPAAPSPEKDTPAAPPADSGDMEARLAAIRAEKLTERQLRIAKRIAVLIQPPSNPFHAQLRQGIEQARRVRAFFWPRDFNRCELSIAGGLPNPSQRRCATLNTPELRRMPRRKIDAPPSM